MLEQRQLARGTRLLPGFRLYDREARREPRGGSGATEAPALQGAACGTELKTRRPGESFYKLPFRLLSSGGNVS